jgi:hypothetical protein
MPESAISPRESASAISIDSQFASSEADIYMDKPFYGGLFRVNGGQPVFMQSVDKTERLTLSKFLEQKNISRGSFLLKIVDENGNDKEIPFQVDKNAEMESSPLTRLPGSRQPPHSSPGAA